MLIHDLVIALKVIGVVLAALWASAYLVFFIRRLLNGPDKLEVIDQAFIDKYEKQASTEGWIHRILVVVDIAGNVFFRGQEDETISTHSWRASLQGKLWGRVMNYWLDLYQSQHGPKAAVGDLYRAKCRIATLSKLLNPQSDLKL